MRQNGYEIVIAVVNGFVIAGAVVAAATIVSLFSGCATQPPPLNPPVVVQAPSPPKPAPPPDPYAGLPSDIAAAIQHHQTPVLEHGITVIYPYSADDEYPVNCQPLHATTIRLGPDEYTSEKNVILGDSERWSTTVGDGVVLVKPLRTDQTVVAGGPQPEVHPPSPHMSTNLLIHTDKHDYTLTLQIRKPMTEAIAWYYPEDVRAGYAAHVAALKEQRQ